MYVFIYVFIYLCIYYISYFIYYDHDDDDVYYYCCCYCCYIIKCKMIFSLMSLYQYNINISPSPNDDPTISSRYDALVYINRQFYLCIVFFRRLQER